MECYSHFISLGYFCSVASELERIGLRSVSSPFDWCISDFKGVILAIEQEFEGFLDCSNLMQNSERHEIYYNEKYNLLFYHDFDKYIPLEKQIKKVKDKYDRRIKRFYENILEPTLFIRYISDEKRDSHEKSLELCYIEQNYEKIIGLLKKFNACNDILFVANKSVYSDKLKIYSVEPDENDLVARSFLDKNHALMSLLNSYEFPEREKNLTRFNQKIKKRQNVINRLSIKLNNEFKKHLLKEYIHNRQCNIF